MAGFSFFPCIHMRPENPEKHPEELHMLQTTCYSRLTEMLDCPFKSKYLHVYNLFSLKGINTDKDNVNTSRSLSKTTLVLVST